MLISLENSDCFQLFLKTMINSYIDIFTGLKLTTRQNKFMTQYHFWFLQLKYFLKEVIMGEILFFVALFFVIELHLKQQWGKTNSKRDVNLSLKVLLMMKKRSLERWRKIKCFENNDLVDNWHNKINLTFPILIKLV